MPKFPKLIVTPGVHRVGRLSGQSEVVAITPERIAEWVKNTNQLRSLGVSIPAPFAHQDKNHNFPLPVVIGEDGASLADAYAGSAGITWDSSVNGGFWDDPFEVDPVSHGLRGIVDAPGEEGNPDTPAGKVGKVVRETSVLVMGPRKVIGRDGIEHQIGEHLAHVAMVLHPAQPGQLNFEPPAKDSTQLPEAERAIAMSFAMSDMVTTGTTSLSSGGSKLPGNTLDDPTKAKDQELVDCMAMLANVAYISLPPDTARENFITNLGICLRQKSADQQEKEKEEESLTTKPPGSEVKSPSIAMAQVIDPKTGKPVPGSEAQPNSSDALLALFMSNLIKTKKKSLQDRVAALVASGRCSKQYADEKLYARITAIVMSPDQLVAAKGETPRDPIEDLIEGLEQAQPLTGPSLTDDPMSMFQVPQGSSVEDNPTPLSSEPADIPDKEADEILEYALG